MISVFALRWGILPFFFLFLHNCNSDLCIFLLLCWHSLEASLKGGFNRNLCRFEVLKQKQGGLSVFVFCLLHLVVKRRKPLTVSMPGFLLNNMFEGRPTYVMWVSDSKTFTLILVQTQDKALNWFLDFFAQTKLTFMDAGFLTL